jgi:hypothetical protein
MVSFAILLVLNELFGGLRLPIPSCVLPSALQAVSAMTLPRPFRDGLEKMTLGAAVRPKSYCSGMAVEKGMLLWGYRLEVKRICTSLVSAKMVNMVPLRDGTKKLLKNEAVDGMGARLKGHLPITVLLTPAFPNQTPLLVFRQAADY